MLGLNLKVLGAEALIKKLGKETIQTPLAEGIRKITLWLDRLVKQSTPVGISGRLRSSIYSEVFPLYGKVGTIVTYAPFVEYGTKNMEARHVEAGSSTRILGQGMFSYSLEKLKEAVPEHLKEIAGKITAQWKF